jgi:hypothetical protein
MTAVYLPVSFVDVSLVGYRAVFEMSSPLSHFTAGVRNREGLVAPLPQIRQLSFHLSHLQYSYLHTRLPMPWPGGGRGRRRLNASTPKCRYNAATATPAMLAETGKSRYGSHILRLLNLTISSDTTVRVRRTELSIVSVFENSLHSQQTEEKERTTQSVDNDEAATVTTTDKF